jgi:hypothetical protein
VESMLDESIVTLERMLPNAVCLLFLATGDCREAVQFPFLSMIYSTFQIMGDLLQVQVSGPREALTTYAL